MCLAAYICGVVGAAAVGAVVLLILPQEDRREVGLICRLGLLLVLAAPLAKLPSLIDDIGKLYSVLTEPEGTGAIGGMPDDVLRALEGQSRAEIAEAMGEDICRRFELAREDVLVRPQLEISESGEVRLLAVRLIFTGRAMWQDPHRVLEYIAREYGVTCEIAEG